MGEEPVNDTRKVERKDLDPRQHSVPDLPIPSIDRDHPISTGSEADFEDDPELEELEQLEGEILDTRYKITKELARGGMGVVFRAEHVSLGRPVVIKVLKATQVGSSTAKARFEREARRACQLDHPNIVTVHDFGYHEDLGYLVMEFVDGITLYDYLKKYGPLTFTQFAPVAAAVLSGLAEAHRHEIIHRDIKASNIMLTFDGDRLRRVKILDFGLAKVAGDERDDVTKQSNLVGTMGAMPPERILCKETDLRVDLYAFGVCAYRMITGKRPFVGDDMHVLYQHVHEQPAPLTERLGDDHDYPIMVLEWVHRLLAKDPDDRPRDASQAREWLLETISDTSIFRLDEGHVAWQEHNGQPLSAAASGTFEFTEPSWSRTSNSASYRSLLGNAENTAALVAEMRKREEAPKPPRRSSSTPSVKTFVAAGIATLTITGVVAVGVAMLGEQDAGQAQATAPQPVPTQQQPAAPQPAAPTPTERNIDEVFSRIESDLDRGAYGTAENLLDSVRQRLELDPENQVRAAEFQTRIDIDKNLRKAHQAEKSLRIEDAMTLYDAVLSLDAGNAEAKERHAALAKQVVLKVTADPNGTVYLDDEKAGKTPLEKMVPADFSRVEIRAPGYREWSASLIPDGGTRVELSAELRRRGGRTVVHRNQQTHPSDDHASDDEHQQQNNIDNENLMHMGVD